MGTTSEKLKPTVYKKAQPTDDLYEFFKTTATFVCDALRYYLTGLIFIFLIFVCLKRWCGSWSFLFGGDTSAGSAREHHDLSLNGRTENDGQYYGEDVHWDDQSLDRDECPCSGPLIRPKDQLQEVIDRNYRNDQSVDRTLIGPSGSRLLLDKKRNSTWRDIGVRESEKQISTAEPRSYKHSRERPDLWDKSPIREAGKDKKIVIVITSSDGQRPTSKKGLNSSDVTKRIDERTSAVQNEEYPKNLGKHVLDKETSTTDLDFVIQKLERDANRPGTSKNELHVSIKELSEGGPGEQQTPSTSKRSPKSRSSQTDLKSNRPARSATENPEWQIDNSQKERKFSKNKSPEKRMRFNSPEDGSEHQLIGSGVTSRRVSEEGLYGTESDRHGAVARKMRYLSVSKDRGSGRPPQDRTGSRDGRSDEPATGNTFADEVGDDLAGTVVPRPNKVDVQVQTDR